MGKVIALVSLLFAGCLHAQQLVEEITHLEYRQCWPTNYFDADGDIGFDANGDVATLEYYGTNIIKWRCFAGAIYTPQWATNLSGTNTQWHSNCNLSTNADGFLEAEFKAYVIDGPQRFYRICVTYNEFGPSN